MSYTKEEARLMAYRLADNVAPEQAARMLKEIEDCQSDKQNKYGTAAVEDRTWIDHHGRLGDKGKEIKFHSAKELGRWVDLLHMELAGEITDLCRQNTFYCDLEGQRIATYVADFVYNRVSDGKRVIEDVKGWQKGTAYDLFLVKKRLVEYIFKTTITIV